MEPSMKKMAIKMTRCLHSRVCASDSPYLARQRCRGKPRPPMGPRAPCWFGGGMTRCTKSRGVWNRTTEITRAVFTQGRAAVRRKTLLLLWCIDGGNMVANVAHLPGKVTLGRECLCAYECVRVRISQPFLRSPWDSFYRLRGHHSGKLVIMH